MLYNASICVQDVDRSARFYDSALAPLGYRRILDLGGEAVAFGDERAEFWVQSPTFRQTDAVSQNVQYGFTAKSRTAVDNFYTAAVAAGSKVILAPGSYPQFHPDFYGTVVTDPDGNTVEVVVFPYSLSLDE